MHRAHIESRTGYRSEAGFNQIPFLFRAWRVDNAAGLYSLTLTKPRLRFVLAL
jgi:hypothetical protein